MDDGIRSLEDPVKYNDVLLATLNELEVPFIEIGQEIRSIQDRVQVVKRVLQQR